MANWLSTRVATRGSALVVPSDHAGSASERARVASRLATARTLGLVVVPGAYIAQPKGGVGDATGADEGDDEYGAPHLLHCSACQLDCRASHYHCCACQRVFRGA